MSQVSTIIQAARDFAALPGWSKWKLARESGLHQNTLRNLYSEDVVFDSSTLEKVERFLSAQKFLNN